MATYILNHVLCIYFLLNDLNRGDSGIRVAIICCIHKFGLLLYYWGASWIFDGLALQSRSCGMFCYPLCLVSKKMCSYLSRMLISNALRYDSDTFANEIEQRESGRGWFLVAQQLRHYYWALLLFDATGTKR